VVTELEAAIEEAKKKPEKSTNPKKVQPEKKEKIERGIKKKKKKKLPSTWTLFTEIVKTFEPNELLDKSFLSKGWTGVDDRNKEWIDATIYPGTFGYIPDPDEALNSRKHMVFGVKMYDYQTLKENKYMTLGDPDWTGIMVHGSVKNWS
jgi:hypothetical protein